MAPLALILMFAYGSSVVFALMYLSGACALALPRRQALVAAVAVAATMLAFCLHLRQSVANTAVFVFVTLMAPVIVLGTRRLLLLIAELHQAREELARLAVAEERLRFARDLHDLLGHSLSLIVVKSQLARKLADRGADDGEAVAREVRDIEAVAQQSLVEVREAVSGYRRRSLAAELDGARSALQTAAIDVTVRTSGTPLPATTEALLVWAVREGVTNVVRHSQARHCEIEVRRADGVATLEVRDDGRGPAGAPAGAGSGLRGLAERVEVVGGHVEAGAATNAGGFRLAVAVPLASAAPAPQSSREAPPAEPAEPVER